MKREKQITCMKIMAAVAVCAAGVALLVLADWGLDPLTNFEYALSRKPHISLGKASMLFEGLTFFLFFFSNRKLVKFGSFAFCFGIGPCIDFWGYVFGFLEGQGGFAFRMGCLLLGSLLIILSFAYYIPLNYGLQSLDMYSVSIASLLKKQYGVGLTITYCTLILLAALLGVRPGVVTFVATFAYGAAIDGVRKLFKW